MTNKPILYCAPTIPPSRAVLLTAAEIGVDLDLRIIDLENREHRSPEYLKISPLGAVPALDDNGTILTESHVICMYLADNYSTNEHLYPKDFNARNVVLSRLFVNSGYLDARLWKVIEPIIRFGSTELWQDAVEYIQQSYCRLESFLQGQPYLCGQYLTIADLCCIATMSSSHDFSPVLGDVFPNLLAWMDRMSQLPYYGRCNGQGAEILKQRVMAKLEANRINGDNF